jgi:hypothetical protein
MYQPQLVLDSPHSYHLSLYLLTHKYYLNLDAEDTLSEKLKLVEQLNHLYPIHNHLQDGA